MPGRVDRLGDRLPLAGDSVGAGHRPLSRTAPTAVAGSSSSTSPITATHGSPTLASFGTWAAVAAEASFAETERLTSVPNRFLGSIFSARSARWMMPGWSERPGRSP